jgi:hypothetical protein
MGLRRSKMRAYWPFGQRLAQTLRHQSLTDAGRSAAAAIADAPWKS